MGEALEQYKQKHPGLEGIDLILSLLKDLNEKQGRNKNEIRYQGN